MEQLESKETKVEVEVEVTPPAETESKTGDTITVETTLEQEKEESFQMGQVLAKVQTLEQELNTLKTSITEQIQEGNTQFRAEILNLVQNLQLSVEEDLTEKESENSEKETEQVETIPALPPVQEVQDEPVQQNKRKRPRWL